MTPHCVETAVTFDCAGNALVGVVSTPRSGPTDADAVLVVVGGPQYRAGSHRQFVGLARALAAAGHTTLRFDARGMGDSEGEPAGFEGLSDDIAAAIGTLRQHAPQARGVRLFGLCDGASAALLYLHDTQDPRVTGLGLLNPWLRSDASLARTHVRHYYLRRLASGDFWRKLLHGDVGARALREFATNLRRGYARPRAARGGPEGPGDATAAPGRRGRDFRDAMRRAASDRPLPTLLALSGDDLTAREFADAAAADADWRRALSRPGVRRVDLPGADHTLSEPTASARLESELIGWMRAGTPPASPPADARPAAAPGR